MGYFESIVETNTMKRTFTNIHIYINGIGLMWL